MHTESPQPMPDRNDRSAPAGVSGTEGGFLDLQRAGLQELLNLSSAIATPAQSEVEDRFRQASASAERALQKSVAEIETEPRRSWPSLT